jgi:stage II sporulation protein AA (anti-sigma F factor antagonist)
VTDLANLSLDSSNGVVIATLSGEVDLSNATQITRDLLNAVPNEALGLVVDLSSVSYLDSAGIRMLAELERRLGWRAQALRIAAPQESRCRMVLSVAGLDGLLSMEVSVEAARASLAAPDAAPKPPD